ncbi:MAG: FkbM family methyltransferase [Terriglobia bacterium]
MINQIIWIGKLKQDQYLNMLNLDEGVVPAAKQEVFQRLMSGTATPIYVLGRNKYAERVSRRVPVQAFIDDFTEEKLYLERPVIRMSELPAKCLVVSCVLDTLPVTALNRLRSAGVHEVIDYFTCARLSPNVFAPVDFCAGNRQDILENPARYMWVWDRLADQISKRHFAQVVQFRLSVDLKYMEGFKLAIDQQYFEDFLPLHEAEVFVDGGGYDGQTSLQFAAWNKAYHGIYCFEPAPAMMEVSRRNLAGLRDVSFLQKGLFSRNDRLRFDTGAGLASSISALGQSEIEVVCLDDEVHETITFLKLDIEGAEYEALQGAAEHIRSASPTMAVCIYHDQRDFWRVPLRVLEMN